MIIEPSENIIFFLLCKRDPSTNVLNVKLISFVDKFIELNRKILHDWIGNMPDKSFDNLIQVSFG